MTFSIRAEPQPPSGEGIADKRKGQRRRGGPCDAGRTTTARSILPLLISVRPSETEATKPAVNAARGGAAEAGGGANAQLASLPEGGTWWWWWWWKAGNPEWFLL